MEDILALLSHLLTLSLEVSREGKSVVRVVLYLARQRETLPSGTISIFSVMIILQSIQPHPKYKVNL